MATTRLSDVIVPSVFAPYVQLLTTELSALFQANIISTDPQITALARGEGKTFNMPFFNDLVSDDSNVGNDDPSDTSTPKKTTAGQDVAVKHYRNQSWSSADLVAAVIGPDPMQAIASRVANYWVRDFQKILISSLTGVIEDNVTNDGGDMVHDISNDDPLPVSPAEKVSAEAIIATLQTSGDAQNSYVAIAMHSVVYSELKRQNLIDFVPNSSNPDAARIAYYMGMRVIVDDGCPAVAGDHRIKYTSYLFGAGAVAFGEGSPKVPVETERKPDQGMGEGVEVLYSRRHFIMHPRGIKFTNVNVSSSSPTNSELADGTNWDRVYDRKLIRFAALITNG